ncbi:DUF1329 domain-containing protein [Paraburkholderia sacchari]|uniref:DUF1329 domain-containing protein n=1 Tax=Paraburkholderia sacchari TaxID=159450 RepID=UPI000543AC4D|nr:DUF1329 domain-containing protein [Paraburkholderia sacchari]
MMKKRSMGAACIVAATVSVACLAASADNLTPAGANPAASSDGVVPAFAGREAPEQGWAYGKYRGDFWKHRAEKPLYSIDASNVDKYAAHLSAGQIQLIKQRKGYRMDVYPAHRECQLPEVAEQNSRENLTAAKLDAGGSMLQSAYFPGVAFPKPQNGAEAILNFEYRYRGVGIEWPSTTTAVSPRPGSDDWIMTMGPQSFYLPSGKLGKNTPSDVDQLSLAGYFGYNSPAAMAGQGGMQRQYYDKDSETFYYFPGQRRVRRMPAYTHDAPQIGYENQYTVDDANMFNGFIDRFDWKLIGKREMLVPYNDFAMYDFNAKFADVAKPDGLSEASRRYEMHRVWVVEATVKPTARHVASKKIFYLDEDSWLALVGEDYDAQGKLWKVREGYPIPVWELGGACDLEAFAQYDLNDGRYVFDQSPIGAGKDIHWYSQSNDSRFKSDYYSAETLRSISER